MTMEITGVDVPSAFQAPIGMDHVLVRLVWCVDASMNTMECPLHNEGFSAKARGEVWVHKWILGCDLRIGRLIPELTWTATAVRKSACFPSIKPSSQRPEAKKTIIRMGRTCPAQHFFQKNSRPYHSPMPPTYSSRTLCSTENEKEAQSMLNCKYWLISVMPSSLRYSRRFSLGLRFAANVSNDDSRLVGDASIPPSVHPRNL